MGTQQDADEYGIELDRYSNWQDAEVALTSNFEDYSAIILDANCKIKPTESIKEEFITAVLPSLTRIFGEKQKMIPWYILSAGTMRYFEHTISGAKYQHEEIPEWGQMLYIKDAPDGDFRNSKYLYENIIRVAKEQTNNVVLFRHKDVFEYLGEGKLIDGRARKIMLKMLCALYYPEENIGYEFKGNPIRNVIEYVFRAAHKQGILADECFDREEIKLQLASLYLAGANVSYDRTDKTKQVRWGDEGDFVLPEDEARLMQNLLCYSNVDSHTKEKKPYFIDEQKKELFFGYVMQLCHIIKWFGNYASEHANIEENRKMQRTVDVVSEDSGKKQVDLESARKRYEKEEVVPTCDNGIWHYKECCVSVKYWTEGNKMVITEVSLNTNKQTKSDYPYFAKYKILKSSFSNNK